MRSTCLYRLHFALLAALSTASLLSMTELARADEPAAEVRKVSYAREIEPLFRTHCQGCHQPAKPQGEYVMTDFAKLFVGGETGDAAIVPGKPDESHLLKQITKVDGKAAMPKKAEPLGDADVELVRRWIAEGAVDDRTATAAAQYTMENPPTYTRCLWLSRRHFLQTESGWQRAAFMKSF